MAPYEFGILELIQGTFSTIFVIATIYIGHIFISRYFKHRNRNLYLFGFFWIGIAFVFILFPVQLFAILFGVTVAFEPFFISIFGFLPVTSLSWLLATTDLLNLKNRINILRIYVVIAILFEILFFILFFMHPIASFIGIRTSLFDIDWTSFAQLYLLVFLSIDIVFGIKLGLSSMDSSDPEMTMKGRLFLISITFFVVGALLDLIIPSITSDISIRLVVTIIGRLVMMSSSIIFYVGFMLPDWSKKILFR